MSPSHHTQYTSSVRGGNRAPGPFLFSSVHQHKDKSYFTKMAALPQGDDWKKGDEEDIYEIRECYCPSCRGGNAVTLMLPTKVPLFREIIVMSLACEVSLLCLSLLHYQRITAHSLVRTVTFETRKLTLEVKYSKGENESSLKSPVQKT
jgi:hypothetical protein